MADSTFSFTWAGTGPSMTRTGRIHAPTTTVNSPAPCIFCLHGGGSSGLGMEAQCLMNAVADPRGLVVVYPDGTGGAGQYNWNAVTCCGLAMTDGVDDVGFLRQLAANVVANNNVDPNRIYCCGFSNGAMMTWRLWREASDVFAGFAAVSGDINAFSPSPANPAPFLYIQGGKDAYCPAEGGVGSQALTNTYHIPAQAGLRQAQIWNRCAASSSIPVDPGLAQIQSNLADGVFMVYPGLAPVGFVFFPEGGHQWPGGTDDGLPNQTLITDWNASLNIWQQLSSYSLQAA